MRGRRLAIVNNIAPPSRSSSYLTFEAVGLVAVEALGVCIGSVSCEFSLSGFRGWAAYAS
jgi:hypothetical protein